MCCISCQSPRVGRRREIGIYDVTRCGAVLVLFGSAVGWYNCASRYASVKHGSHCLLKWVSVGSCIFERKETSYYSNSSDSPHHHRRTAQTIQSYLPGGDASVCTLVKYMASSAHANLHPKRIAIDSSVFDSSPACPTHTQRDRQTTLRRRL